MWAHVRIAFVAVTLAFPAAAERLVVPPGSDLQAVIDRAVAGDTVLIKGEHRGVLTLTKTVTVEGEAGASLVGPGRGSVVIVTAPGAVVRGLIVRGSGIDLEALDAGVFVEKSAAGAIVENNRLVGNLYGICLHGAPNAVARNNQIVGISEGRINEAGNGISVWSAPGAQVLNNDVRYGRDGIFAIASKNNLRGGACRLPKVSDSQVHHTYTDDSEVSDNISTNNTVGFAIMYVFIYNANKNKFRENWFEGCEIGVHFTAGSEGNEITGNAFVNNRNQVKYVGTRDLDWSKDGRGNYWSDNPSFDLNGDGIADGPYRPNDLVDRVLWIAPLAKVLTNSPAVQIIRWAQSQFPAILPGGVVDSRPLMTPPQRALQQGSP